MTTIKVLTVSEDGQEFTISIILTESREITIVTDQKTMETLQKLTGLQPVAGSVVEKVPYTYVSTLDEWATVPVEKRLRIRNLHPNNGPARDDFFRRD